jgi:hypothetical protein
MDKKLKKRITLFYIGGVFNGVLGIYVLLQGSTFLPSDTAHMLVLIFFAFTALDFYFPHAIKKKWLAENAARQAQGSDQVRQS